MSKLTINYFIGGAIITTAAAIGAMLVIVPHTQKIQIQAKPVAVAQSADPHAGHNMPRMSETTSPEIELAKAKLSITGKLVPKRPVTMTIDIQDLKGESIDKFDTFQEKLMHLIVVSNDLTEFTHLHPTYQQKGKFVVSANFPTSGKYTLFSDYKPTGIAEQVSVLTTQIQGKVMPPESPSFKSSKTIGNTEASLEIEAQNVTTGKMVQLNFNLVDANTKKSIDDLQPYLGERGHLVIIRQASEITKANYIHAHAMADTGNGKIQFMTTFPLPGKYKLWGQFNRNGKIVVADFWVSVS